MAESSLSVNFAELQDLVTRFAGWIDDASWTSQNTADFAIIVRRGLRRYYWPPPIEPGQPAHGWSFLRREGRISLEAGRNLYDLPDDFVDVLDPSMTYLAGAGKRALSMVHEYELAAVLGKALVNGDPQYFAIRVKPNAPTDGQRWECLLAPTPTSTSGTLRYRYSVLPDTLSSTNIHPWGGAQYSALVCEAVLAEAEIYLDDDASGVHNQRFMEMLGQAIRQDQEAKSKTTPEAERS